MANQVLSAEMLKQWGSEYDKKKQRKREADEHYSIEATRGDYPDMKPKDIVPMSKGKADALENIEKLRNKPKASPELLLKMIGDVESAKGYDFEFGNRPLPLSDMTLHEVLRHQEKRRGEGAKSSAVGRYQFIYETLGDIVRRNPKDFPTDAKFTPELQDKAATLLMERRGLSKYTSGDMDEKTFAKNLSMEWASLPDPDTGRSYYDGDGTNRALTTSKEMTGILRKAKAGKG
jgi:muramidase (phage lysozyme)